MGTIVEGRLGVVTGAPAETEGIGEAIAQVLAPGDVVVLTGDLGAGKTTLVRGAARALGVTAPVASPTFVLVREYRGTMPVHHVDVYRLDRIQEVLDLGFEDLVDPDGVLLVEWGDLVDALLPESYLEVELTVGDGEERRLVLTGRGRRWAERWERLEAAVEGREAG